MYMCEMLKFMPVIANFWFGYITSNFNIYHWASNMFVFLENIPFIWVYFCSVGVYLFACLFSALNSIDEIPKQHSKRKMCATILAALNFCGP